MPANGTVFKSGPVFQAQAPALSIGAASGRLPILHSAEAAWDRPRRPKTRNGAWRPDAATAGIGTPTPAVS